MNAPRRNFLLIAAVAGITLGFAGRWMQHGGSLTGKSPAPAPSRVVAAISALPASASAPAQKLTPLAAHLEQQLAVSTGVMRWLEWMAALEKATLADFPHLARMTKGNSVVLRMIAARWIELNPAHLFETLVATAGESESKGGVGFPRSTLGQQLFEDWSQRDPGAAIAALSRPDSPSTLRDMRFTVLNSVMKNDPELGLRTMAAWHIENYGTGTDGIAKWAAANPRHAAEFALAHPAGFTTQTAMEVIGKAWAKTDPGTALTFAAGCKDNYGVALAAGIVKEWAGTDLPKAAAWFAAAAPSVRNRFSDAMVEVWAKIDTDGAMEWIQQNLSGSSLDEAVGAVLKGAAEKDVAAAADLVAGMDESPGRAKAAFAVAKKWLPEYGSGKPAPPETIAWLSSLDPDSIKYVVGNMQWQWVGSDPSGFSTFLLSPAGQHAPEYAFATIARELSRKNPAEALTWASQLPEARRSEASVQVFSEWQRSQPAAAAEWLRSIPAADPRRESFYLATLRDYMPGGDAAAAVAKEIASGSPAAVRATVENLTIPAEHKQKLLDRLQQQ